MAKAIEPGRQAPLIIGHRGGASGYLPEHTLEAYALGVELGADYLEPDLVATRDGRLIVRHEPNLAGSTNVAELPRFAGRRRKAVIDGVEQEGFFASDFTLAEIETLRAVQPFAERDQRFNGRFRIPTLEEVIALARRKTHEKGRSIGIYPETKHPTYHQRIGLALEDRLLARLAEAGWEGREAPVFIQSFETANLKYLRQRTAVKLIQLIGASGVSPDGTLAFAQPDDRPYDWTVAGRQALFSHLATPAGLAEVRAYADGIGPWKRYIVGVAAAVDETGGEGDESRWRLLPPSTLVEDAHRAGLLVHPYTFRDEPRRLAADYRGNPTSEYLHFFQLGVDGVFSDFAGTALAARAMHRLLADDGYARLLVGEER